MTVYPHWHRSWLMPCVGSYCLPFAEQHRIRMLRGAVRYRGGVVKPARLNHPTFPGQATLKRLPKRQ